jgi:hypothetical protein
MSDASPHATPGSVPDEAPVSPPPEPPSSRKTASGLWQLGGSLLLLILGVLSSPIWAPSVALLLPWGSASAPREDVALAARVAVLEKRAAGNADDHAALDALSGRIARLEAADQPNHAAAQRLEQRTAALETQWAQRPAIDPAAMAALQSTVAAQQKEQSRIAGIAGELTDKLAAVQKRVAAEDAGDRTNAGLMLALLQIREAVGQGRPFFAEYDAFQTLARSQPDISAAAQPLVEAAKSGAPGGAALARRLSELATAIATAQPAPAEPDWREQTLARLRSLVTIRRIAGPGRSAPEVAVGDAERALAGGDLGAAVAKLETLSGANADAARPWLQMARQRLAIDRALAQVQQLLVQHVAAAAAARP